MRPKDFIFISVFILGSIIGLYFINSVGISGASSIEWVADESYTLNESSAVTINLFAAFSSSSPLNFTVAEQPELYVVLDGGNLLVAPAPGASGNVPLTITADDGNDTFTKTISFVVQGETASEELTAAPSAPEPSFGTMSVPSFSPSVITTCGTVSANDSLGSNITANIGNNESCIYITADNVTLDCAGFTILGNGSGVGVNITDRNNTELLNCIITNFTTGILMNRSNYSDILNDTANLSIAAALDMYDADFNHIFDGLYQSGDGYGIRGNYSDNNTFRRLSVITTNGTGMILDNATVFLLQNTSIQSVTGIALHLFNGTNGTLDRVNMSTNNGTALNLITNNTGMSRLQFYSNNTWIHIFSVNNTNGDLLVFNASDGSMEFSPAAPVVAFSDGNNSIINQSNLNISFNRTFVNTTNLSLLNKTGQIMLDGISFTDPEPKVDFEDDGTFIDCSSSICTEHSYSGGTYVYNVTHFTTYSSAENITEVTACGTVSVTSTLVNNVSSSGTCITIGGSNLTFDCAGNTIFYDTGGTGGDGIVASNRVNITIKNCVVIDNSTGGATGIGIDFTSVNNSVIQNNSIQTNGTSDNYGIRLTTTARNNNITNNTIRTWGSSTTNIAINVINSVSTAQSDNNTISENILMPDGASTDNYGIRLSSNIFNTTILNNSILTNGTTNGRGISTDSIASTSVERITIINNTIRTNGSSSGPVGMRFDTRARHGYVFNNTINTGRYTVTSSSHGIHLITSTTNFTITNNSIQTNGTTGNNGVRLESLSQNSTIENNTINADGSTSANIGIHLLTTIVNVTVMNNTISTDGTSGNIGINIVTNSHNITVLNNSVRTNGTSTVAGTNYGIQLTSTIGNVTMANNSIRTSGSIDNHGIRLISTAANNTVENNTILATARNAAGASNAFGIIVSTTSFANNVTGNVVTTTGGGNTNSGITLTTANGSRVINNTIITNGTTNNFGIYLNDGGSDSVIQNNSVITNGTSTGNTGIRMEAGVTSRTLYTTISGNIIRTNGTSANEGIHLTSTRSDYNSVYSNDINASGTASGSAIHGILLFRADNNTIENNTINVSGNSANYGIRLQDSASDGSEKNNITGNVIYVNGTTGIYGLGQESTNENFYKRNHIYVRATQGFGISITLGSFSHFNDTVLNDTTSWINQSVGLFTNFTNMTFITGNGSIQIPGLFQLNSTQVVNRNRLNIALNGSFINVTNLTVLNQSAQITLNGLTSTNPVPIVDYEDDGTFVSCGASICTPVSFIGSTYIFDVTHFTNYSTTNGSGCGTITADTNLSNSVSSTGTCFTIDNDNVTLDCSGYTITFDTAGGGSVAGVISVSQQNVTIKNCIINDGNKSGGGDARPIWLDDTNITTILNNTLRSNGTTNDYAIYIIPGAALNVNSILIENNSILTNESTGTEGVGIRTDVSTNVTVRNNTIITNGTTANYGFFGFRGFNHTFERNTIVTNGTGDGNFAIYYFFQAHNITVHNNTIISEGPGTGGTNPALYLNFLQDSVINNNSIVTRGSSVTTGNVGVYVLSGGNDTFENNTISTGEFGASNYGIEAISLENMTRVVNNTINTRGTAGDTGIVFTSVTYGVISNNSITTHGDTSTSHGILMNGATTFINVTNNIIRTNGSGGSNSGIRIISGNPMQIWNNSIVTNGSTTSANRGIDVDGTATNTSIINNTIITGDNTSTDNYGIYVLTGDNTTILNSNIVTFGDTSSGIFVSGGSVFVNNANITTLNGTSFGISNVGFGNFSNISMKSTAWISASAVSNFTNITFYTDNGSIHFPANFTITGVLDQNELNITFNGSYLDSAAFQTLNQSAQIILRDLPFTNPSPIVDYEDDGTFADCGAVCAEISYAGGVFVFNVTHFTNFSASESSISITITSGNFTANITPEQSAICTFQTDNLSAASGCFVVVSSTFNGTALSILNNGTSAFGLNITPDVCPFDGACIQQVKANGTAGLPSNASCNPALNFITVTAGTPTNIHKNVPAGEQVFVSLNYTFSINGTPPGFKIVAYNFTTVSDAPYFDPAC